LRSPRRDRLIATVALPIADAFNPVGRRTTTRLNAIPRAPGPHNFTAAGAPGQTLDGWRVLTIEVT